MSACKSALNVVTVVLDVQSSLLTECLASGDDLCVTTVLAHCLGREVGMCTCTVPVTLYRLRVEGSHYLKLLSDAVEQPARYPELVRYL